VGAGMAVIMLVVGLVVSLTSDRSMVEERLGRYVERERPVPKESRRASAQVTEWLNQQVTSSSFGERLARELARADIKLKPGEYVAIMIIVGFGVGVLGYFLGGRSLLVALAGGAIGLFLPRFYVASQQNRRLIRFNEQLSDMLNLMVNGLRAGYSTMQAMEAVSKELPSPICDEFRRVVQEMQLGVPMQQSLENLLRRIPSEDLDLVVTAINVQREVGGKLAVTWLKSWTPFHTQFANGLE